MRITEIEFNVKNYNNWVRYNNQSLTDDFAEYKSKETSKWKRRSEQIGARWPLFKDIAQFKDALDNAQVVEIDRLGDVDNLTKNSSLDSIRDMVGGYTMPRDVDRIVQGLKQNVKLPLPIILRGRNAMWIMAGNTRQSTSKVMGVKPRALLVDVSA